MLLLLAHKRLSVLWLRRIASKAQVAHVNAVRMDTAHVSSNVNHHRLAVNSSTHFASVPATPRSGVHSKFAAQASAAADVIVNALALRHHRQPHPAAAAPHPGPPALRCMGSSPNQSPSDSMRVRTNIANVSKLILRKPFSTHYCLIEDQFSVGDPCE